MVAAPTKDPKNNGKVKLELQPVLYPHEILQYLYDTVGLRIPREDVHTYWTNARSSRQAWSLETNAGTSHIPVGLYGDGARLSTVFQTENIFGLFLNLVLFRPASVRSSRFLLWSGERSRFFKNRTLNKILRVLVWSLNHAYAGVFPSTDYKGNPINDPRSGQPLTKTGDCFAVTELRGDWEFHVVQWRFKHCSWKTITPCFRCPCRSKSGNPKELYYTTDETADPCLLQLIQSF